MAALAALEKDKARLQLDRESDKVHCEVFALRIFGNADRVDRLGKADMNTSKAYYAASFFFEILNQFQDLDGDMASKQKYAAWRASEIRKALREGRPPLPPTQEEKEAAEAEGDLAALDQSMSMPTAPSESLSGLNIAGANVAPAPPSTSSAASYETATPSATGMQRFWQGSPVLFCASEGSPMENGTVGCVQPGNRYMVALQDRLVEAADGQLAPALQPGAHGSAISLPPPPLKVLSGVRHRGVTDGTEQAADAQQLAMLPPPHTRQNSGSVSLLSLFVRLPDGTEQAADAQQLAMLAPPHTRQNSGSVRGGMTPSVSSDSLHAPPPPPPAPLSHPGAPPIPTPLQPSGISPPTYPSLGGTPPASFGMPAPPPASFSMPAPPPTTTAPHGMPSPPPPAPYQHPAQPPVPSPPYVAPSRPAAPLAPPAAMAAAPSPAATSGMASHAKPTGAKGLPIQVITDAQKKAKYAVSALNFEDVSSAVQYLNEALHLLTTQKH
ncbi:Vta1 like-domain-containing protein [Dunaliella salina]|uniref:Vta1 like-domain-containing protein n=1 Tax=Dunaliella salina TaxID=3046 RepID=A0ABQ7G354_DUNSA|nr:Vta1 like-domain-containing protein [Dunaliella salina]|eukprot:KAF5829036.1 Vta1 like-domain-containing protein [Dunaliella salina]